MAVSRNVHLLTAIRTVPNVIRKGKKMELEKLSLKKLNELFEIAVYGEHYAIDGANYERAAIHKNNAVELANEIMIRRKSNAEKRIQKYKLQIDKLEKTIGGTSKADRDQVEKLQTKIAELEWILR